MGAEGWRRSCKLGSEICGRPEEAEAGGGPEDPQTLVSRGVLRERLSPGLKPGPLVLPFICPAAASSGPDLAVLEQPSLRPGIGGRERKQCHMPSQ